MSEEPTKRRLAAAVALLVGAATAVLARGSCDQRVPSRPGPARPASWPARAPGTGYSARLCPGRGVRRRRSRACRRRGAVRRRRARPRRAARRGGPADRTLGSDGGDDRPRGASDAPAPAAPGALLQPASGGGKAERFHLADEARKRGIEPVELGPARTSSARPRRHRAWRRRARDGRRRRIAGDRRGVAAEHRPALRVHPCRHPQPLRARPRGRPRRRRRRARRVRRRRRAGRRPRRGQRPRLRQQRLARALRRGRPARGLSRREAPHAARHRADCSAPRAASLDLRWTGPGGQEHQSGVAVLVSNNRYRLGRAVGSGTRPRIDDGLLGITVLGGRRAAARAAGRLSARGASGRRPTSRSTPSDPCPPGSTARRSCSTRPCASAFGPESCACGSHAAPGRLAVGDGSRRHLDRRSPAGAHRPRPPQPAASKRARPRTT